MLVERERGISLVGRWLLVGRERKELAKRKSRVRIREE